MLDGITVKADDRHRHGLPPIFDGETQYGYVVRDDRPVCVPLRPRTRQPVSFAGLFE